jgi:folate-binding protein YgfZ
MTLTDELDLLRHRAALVDRSGRGAVLVTGPEACSFLQALVSADVDALADGDGTHCLLLTPQGKLDVDFRLLRVGDDVWLDCEPGLGGQLAASLARYRIRVQAEVVDRSGEFGVLSVIGPEAPTPDVARPGVLHGHTVSGDARIVRTADGFDVVGPLDALATARQELAARGVAEAGALAYDAYRVEVGIPVQPVDLDGSTIPQEAFLERDAVSFTKGCFIGQELV